MSTFIKRWILAGFIAVLTTPVLSQGVTFELVDSGVLTHTKHGQGIEIRIKPSTFPSGDVPDELFKRLCQHYAPSLIPWVMEQTSLITPEFVAVRLASGGVVGRYVLQAYAIAGGTCGDALD